MDEKFLELTNQLFEHCQKEGIVMALFAGDNYRFTDGGSRKTKDMLVGIMYRHEHAKTIIEAAYKERAIGIVLPE